MKINKLMYVCLTFIDWTLIRLWMVLVVVSHVNLLFLDRKSLEITYNLAYFVQDKVTVYRQKFPDYTISKDC